MAKIFVSFDYDNDKHYKYLLEAWNANDDFDFTFDDGTPQEIDSNNVGRIKAALTNKIKEADIVLVIAGAHVNQPNRKRDLIGKINWINFEVSQAVALHKRIAVVKLNTLCQTPDELWGKKYSLVYGYTEANVIDAIRRAQSN